MDYGVTAAEWRALTATERVRRCVLLAAEARTLAAEASPELAEGYLQLADEWTQLAEEIGKAQASDGPISPS